MGKETVDGKKGVTIMNKAIIPLVLAAFLSSLAYAQTLIFSWRDRAGTVHIVDDLNKVPLHHREDMKTYRIPSTRGAKEVRSKASSKPTGKVREGEEGALRGEWLVEEIGEVRTSITGLEERLEKLEQERETKRIRMIRKRARGGTGFRERGEIEEIDREIEMLRHQLGKRMEALRSLEREKSLQGGQ